MQNKINGGIYRVNLNGSSPAEFTGDHPTLVIRTLKEDDIYLVVPLTTYTKEKMEKAKRKGFPHHIKSTNSIARIDKMQIVHKRNIKNRWKDNNVNLKIKKHELENVNVKVNNYIALSSGKTEKEYNKYIDQYDKTFKDFKDLYEGKAIEENMFNQQKDKEYICIECKRKAVHWLSFDDLIDISQQFYTSHNVEIQFSKGIISINIHEIS
ncbi:type II toxin-antitoxin system PemK/MazF family toxin [Virgibacillus sp. AGTR]|uniref:type II toxin-antitoxin system PemK/MazF family toxin n=1 Tax=Virgibacillus sp. AGTR TaxID=2812055 RepID=UPI001D16183C|nr:type II toxin-antitoxin system PemK/MazF family toxin [Virgibacillus sp. AGTR]MCC2249008.1 type II toxin-antitoxin system PemK/MazF family toxin [Virgibacillus sp. AGTR]